MKWISATDLQDWGLRTDARALLVNMIADLINASHTEITYFRFPGGDKAQVRGFDGDLETDHASTFIPQGKSKWEFGVSKGSSKPLADFTKRDEQTIDGVKQENTLVLINLNTWDHPTKKISEFVNELKEKSKWKDIFFIDGVQLEAWLQIHPAVASKYAKNYLKIVPQLGAMSTEQYWESFSSRFSPTLTEQVSICEQEHLTGLLKDHLSAPPGMLMIGAETPEDLIALSVGTIRTLPEQDRVFAESRTLIVETREAARQLANIPDLVLILKGEAVLEAGVLSKNARVILPAIGSQGRSINLKLVRPSSHNFGKAIETMGIGEEQAYLLAKKCGRSLTILQRLKPNGVMEEPKWKSNSQVLVPAVLAGAWSTTSELDKEILKDLSQKSTYDEYESNLRPLLLLEDPPIDRVKDTWATRSQADAFYFIHQLMGNKEQELFKQSVLKVLGAEAAELDPEAPFSSAPDPAKSYSTWLKNGLANMLLQIVSISEDGGFSVIGASNQAFVDSIIQALPGWGRRHETIVAISEQLATIAEASPNSFLDALESLLEGESKEVSALFNDSDKSIFAKTSPHTYLLWALELLAWDPKHLTKVCELLMRLASIDPGGSTSNRPINSLKEILLPWSPNTYAECAHRLDCLDQLIKINAELGWELLIKLIPSNHDTSFPTQKPRLRDVTPRKPEVLTNAIVWKAQGHIVNRAIELAATSESRLTSLIGYISNFGPDERNKALSTINTFLEQNTSTRESSVWSKLRDEVKRQEFFRTADWALEDSELQKFKTVVEIHQPKDPLIKYTWLFDDWMPHVGKFEDQLEEKTESSRIEAVLTIFEHSGVRGIYDLISRTKIKHLVIETLAKCDFSIEIYTQLAPYLLNDEEPSLEAISTLSAVASVKFGEAWTRYVSLILQLPSMIQSIRTSLVINWAQNQKTWDFIESLGPEDEMAYWTSLNHLPVTGSKEDLDTAIQKFLNYGKAYQVIYSLYNRTPEVETQKILQILGTAISEINSNPKLLNHMFSYYLEKILSNLRLRPELKLEDLAKIEFAYINALDHDIKDLSIHRYIAENPNFYMELISNVFVADGEEPPESTPATKSQATASFNVLNTLKTLPGQSGDHVNFEHLENWITEVRSIALLKKRVDITDQYIGHILAHSPIDDSDQLWPHKSVRIVIENLRNEWIENGIAIERFNMRGVFSRGHYEGGIQELNIADRYRNWSDSMVGFSRTKGLLNRLYDEWVGHAGDADIRAEKNKLKS